MNISDIDTAIDRLEYYQQWRKGGDGEQPHPRQLGYDIDNGVMALKFMRLMLYPSNSVLSHMTDSVDVMKLSFDDRKFMLVDAVHQALKEVEVE